jgi:cytochrome c biogenesis protein CcmG/thiol:disulfide interchange protein DsbE
MMRYLLFGLPLIALIALVAVFAFSIDRDPTLVRSALINRPAPTFAMAEVPELGVPGFDTAALMGEVTVVNVFASWCIPCRDEHPLLVNMREQTGVRLFGINQADADRRVSIDWGVYGVPETFVVDARGIITFKHVGPLTPAAMEDELLPAIAAARG